MTAGKNILIVEDEEEWCDVYLRAAAREGTYTVRIANDLAGAKALIHDMQFAVAFVDIGLNVGDDQNVDGLRVMEEIRTEGDETSIVVVTGRRGRDVLPITRDAIMEYGAFDIAGKSDITPWTIKTLLRTGLMAFEQKASAARALGEGIPLAREVLRGRVSPAVWDDQMLRITSVKNGVQGLYGFIDLLLEEFLPLVARDSEPAAVDSHSGIVHGSYWSRAIGSAVAVCFGSEDRASKVIDSTGPGQMLLDHYEVEKVLKEVSANGLSGAVFALAGVSRECFAGNLFLGRSG